MKTLIPLFLLLLTFSVTACKKNKKDAPSPAPSIKGTWELRSFTNAGATVTHLPGNDTLLVIDSDSTCKWQWGSASVSMTGGYGIEKNGSNYQVMFIKDHWGAIGQRYFYRLRNDGRELTLESPPGVTATEGYKYEKIR